MKNHHKTNKINNMTLSDAILLLQNESDKFAFEVVDNQDSDQFWVKTQQAHINKPEADSVREAMVLIFEATTNGTLHT